MKKKLLRPLCAILLFALTVALFLPVRSGLASTLAEDQYRYQQLQSELNRLKKDQQEIASQLAEAKGDLANRRRVVELLYQEIDAYQEQLDLISDLILEYTVLVDTKKAQITELNEKMDRNYALFKERLVFAQESGTMSYIDFILGSHDLSDILSRGEVINDMLENDRRTIESLISDKVEVEAAKAELESALTACLEKKDEYDALMEERRQKLEEAEAYAAEIADDVAALAAQSEALQASRQKQQEELEALAKQIEDKQRAQIGSANFTGGFIWPLPLSFPGWISQYFHSRHSGMDIHVGGWANNGKIDVLACAAGVVIRTGKYWDWGNLVVIQHNNVYQTYYAHMYDGSVTVKVGDTVAQGQPIGKVGSTGDSTGPHLHIVFVENGVRVDPARFIAHP